jgi:uncharacterized protein
MIKNLILLMGIGMFACTSPENKKIMSTRATDFSLIFSSFKWIHKPKEFEIKEKEIKIVTEPNTDYWQRTYYGFRNDNAPTFVKELAGDFTFSVRTDFNSKKQFDQCGIILYQNSDNWIKASIEYENDTIARLGSVVTNLGYSDWSTTDISPEIKTMWYRLSRKGQDFFIETSQDGNHFNQLRVLHMHEPIEKAQIGIYACSPNKSSFTALFSDFKLGESLWKSHQAVE